MARPFPRTSSGLAAIAASLLLAAGFAQVAPAKTAARSIRTQGEFIAYDAAGPHVVVRVRKPGRGAAARGLEPGAAAKFAVKPEGSVLKRTSVAIYGRTAQLGEIEPGRTVNVYWRPDESDPTLRMARKIDVIIPAEELGGEDAPQ
jgi:hypothetical protein